MAGKKEEQEEEAGKDEMKPRERERERGSSRERFDFSTLYGGAERKKERNATKYL